MPFPHAAAVPVDPEVVAARAAAGRRLSLPGLLTDLLRYGAPWRLAAWPVLALTAVALLPGSVLLCTLAVATVPAAVLGAGPDTGPALLDGPPWPLLALMATMALGMLGVAAVLATEWCAVGALALLRGQPVFRAAWSAAMEPRGALRSQGPWVLAMMALYLPLLAISTSPVTDAFPAAGPVGRVGWWVVPAAVGALVGLDPVARADGAWPRFPGRIAELGGLAAGERLRLAVAEILLVRVGWILGSLGPAIAAAALLMAWVAQPAGLAGAPVGIPAGAGPALGLGTAVGLAAALWVTTLGRAILWTDASATRAPPDQLA